VTRLPDPQQPTAPQAGQPIHPDAARRRAAQIAAAVDDIYAGHQPTAIRVQDPAIPTWQEGPRIGTTPPIPQPGIPPQSRAAVDYAVRVLSTAVATAITSGSLALLMYASKFADPLVCGIVFGAPIGLAVPIAALASFAKRAREVVAATPPVIHQHYSGPITQTTTTINADSHGLIAITRPELPPATR
jgi:hypothetical protein